MMTKEQQLEEAKKVLANIPRDEFIRDLLKYQNESRGQIKVDDFLKIMQIKA